MNLWNFLVGVLELSGMPVAKEADKLISPRQMLKFLGLVISTIAIKNGLKLVTITVNPEKLVKARKQMVSLIHQNKTRKGSITTHQLDKLIGVLVHIAQTRYGARGYYVSALSLRHSPEFDGTLSRGFFIDSQFWLKGFEKYDGTGIIVQNAQISDKFWATDAYRTPNNGPIKHLGIGGFYEGEYFSICGSPDIFRRQLRKMANTRQKSASNLYPMQPSKSHTHTIQYLELFAVYWDLSSRCDRLKNMHVPIFVDNQNGESWLTSGRAPPPYMGLLRVIQDILLDFNITLYSYLIKSKVNDLADLASRGEIAKLFALMPNWRKSVEGLTSIEHVTHLKPGITFLFSKGYYDDRNVTSTWGDDATIMT
jgi:hypothetical protein